MKLYLIDGLYYGTQAEAKPAAALAGIKNSQIGDFEEDVPTDKTGLIAYLNHLTEARRAVDALFGPVEQTERLPAPPIPAAPAPTQAIERATHSIGVEEEIARADYPNAVRLALHATSRVGEHLKAMADKAHASKLADMLS